MSSSEISIEHQLTGRMGRTPIILSSSLGTTADMWEPQLHGLSAIHPILTYDHRGHGSSSVPDGPYTIEQLGRDVLDLMDTHAIPVAHFAGLSLGGMVGMWLAINAPDRIGRLAILCSFASVASPEPWFERAEHVRRSGTESLVDSSVDRWFTAGFQKTHPTTVELLAEMLRGTPNEGYAGCCEAIAGLDLESDLAKIRAATIVISGSEDAGAPPEAGERLAGSILGSRFQTVEAAHLANVEQPETVLRLLLDHFA